MVNVLIADDNVDYAIYLMNYINKTNTNIRVCNIAKNGKETIKILNEPNDFDVILLDYKMPYYNGKQILDNLKNKEKYTNSFIIISGEMEAILNFRKTDLIYSIIYKNIEINEIIKKINQLFEYKDSIKRLDIFQNKIRKELLFLGYDISHKGTQYLIKTIYYVIERKNGEVSNLEKDIYPYIAKICKEREHNIKCRINKATDSMYYNCDVDKLKEYFSFDIDKKPRVKTIITTIINKIQ